ncbi:MAG: methyltransferase [Candidatus Binatia bacterium]
MAEHANSPSTLLDIVAGKWAAQAVAAAAELGIADLLKDGARTSAEIAAKTGVSEDGVYRLLRALAGMKLLIESGKHSFALTDLGKYLQSGVPGSVSGYARFLGHDMTWRPWGHLADSVKSGKAAFDRVFGKAVFEHVAADPEAAATMNEGMTSISLIETSAVVDAYDFSAIGKLVDVGGGHGTLLAAILKANHEMRGVLFEMPHALEGAQKLLTEQGVRSRCEIVGGDFFAAVPPGGDAYILKHIIHDWDDERSIRILRKCHGAMRRGGKLLLAEVVIGAGAKSLFASLLDLEMLVLTPGGRERTREEFEKLYQTAGFKLTGITGTGTHISIVEGVAV